MKTVFLCFIFAATTAVADPGAHQTVYMMTHWSEPVVDPDEEWILNQTINVEMVGATFNGQQTYYGTAKVYQEYCAGSLVLDFTDYEENDMWIVSFKIPPQNLTNPDTGEVVNVRGTITKLTFVRTWPVSGYTYDGGVGFLLVFPGPLPEEKQIEDNFIEFLKIQSYLNHLIEKIWNINPKNKTFKGRAARRPAS